MGAGLWMYWVASQNALSVNDISFRPSPAVSASIKVLGRTQTLQLAQFLAAEQTRSLYEVWGTVQIALAAGCFFFLLFGTRMGKAPLVIGLVLVLVTVAEALLIYPDLGVAATLSVDPSRRVRMMRAALDYGYVVAESLKWLLMTGLSAFLVLEQTRRSRNSRNEVDMVDKADYRHVNR